MASIFSRIVSGEIPAYKIAESEDFVAFLDVFPLTEGHVLVIPKMEIETIYELEADLYRKLFAFTQPIAKAIAKVIPCTKVGYAVVGLEVPHAHIHLVPINSADDLNFTRPKLNVTPEMLAATQEIICQALSSK